MKRIDKLSVNEDVKDKIRANYMPVLARTTENGTITYSKIVHVSGGRPKIPRGNAARVTQINGG